MFKCKLNIIYTECVMMKINLLSEFIKRYSHDKYENFQVKCFDILKCTGSERKMKLKKNSFVCVSW